MNPVRIETGFGASTLVNDVLMQIARQADGNYQGPDYFSLP